MDSRPLFLFFSFLLLLLHSASADPPSPSPSPSDSDFIQSTCNLTLYPDICYTSLSRFSSSISHTPDQIALAAIAVCNSQSHFLSSYLSNLTRDRDHNSDYCFSALRDCSSTLSSAASQIRGSFKQITQLLADDGAGESHIRFQISNVQTWMSAAITNEDTCTDGFDSVPDNSLKSDVCNRVAVVRKLTSNALALVNFYASTVG